MTTGRFQPQDTRTQVALLEQRVEGVERTGERIEGKVDKLDSKLDELTRSIDKRDSDRPGLVVSARTLKFLAPLAMAFGAGLVTVIKLIVEHLGK